MRAYGEERRRRSRVARRLGVGAALLLVSSTLAAAAGGSPQLALVQATPYASSAASVTLEIDGNFNFEDTVQLPLPLEIMVVQGNLTARFDLGGHAFTSVDGAAEQPASGPGVIAVKPHTILLVLPSGFGAGAATVQLVAQYQGATFASNTLEFTL